MKPLREEYRQAVRALEFAYLADRVAYVGLNRRSKDFWGLQPPKSWPDTPDFAPWRRERQRLLAAEQRVVELLRLRCARALERRKQRQARRALACAPYVEQIVETVPDELNTTIAAFLTPGSQGFEAPALAPFLRVH